MILNYLKKLPYSMKGERSVDYVYLYIRRTLTGLFVFNLVSLLITSALSLFRISFPFHIYLVFFIVDLLTLYLSLYLGYWHTNLTSRQRFIIFKGRAPLVEKDRLNLMSKYIKISFTSAIFAALNLVFFTINNFLLVTLNQMWEAADSYLKYNNKGLDYKTLRPLIANPIWNTLLFILPLIILVILFYSSYRNDILPYEEIRKDRFRRRFFRNKNIAHLFTDVESKQDATLVLGENSETSEMVAMKTNEQRLHTAVFGPIGSGKSASFAKNVIFQQIEAMAVYFRKYSEHIEEVDTKFQSPIYRKKFQGLSYREQKEIRQEMYDEWFTKGMGAKYINGIYVNEPSGELIDDTKLMIERAGFPKEMIWRIEPSDEFTDSMNIFDTDTGSAAGIVADLIRSFAEAGGDGGNTFFKDAENAYARNLTILMKSVANIQNAYPYEKLNGNSPTFSEFSDLLEIDGYATELAEILRAYRNAYERHYQKVYLEPYLEKYELEKAKWMLEKAEHDYVEFEVSIPFDEFYEEWKTENHSLINLFEKDIKEEPRYDELLELSIRNRDALSELNIINGSYHYFSDAIVEDRKTGKKYLSHEVNISGMKNTIRKLSSSTLVRRIFFSQSTHNMDVFMKMGGFVLVNSSRGKVDDTISQMIGQITDIIIQKAALRRSAKTYDPFFSIIEDEYGWITTNATEKFLNQSRKYNVAVFGMYQNIEQLDASIGRDGVNALLNSYRNLFAFQGSSKRTTEAIIERAGSEKKLTRTQSRSRDNLIAGHDANNESIREQIEEVEVANSTDLFRMEQFQFAGIHVVDDEESELVKVTPRPSFELDIFKNKGINYTPVFGATNTEHPNHEKDLNAFNIWKKQSELKYIEQLRNNKITSDWFTFPELLVVEGYAVYRGEEIVLKRNIDKDILKQLTKTDRVEYVENDDGSFYYLVKENANILPNDFLKSKTSFDLSNFNKEINIGVGTRKFDQIGNKISSSKDISKSSDEVNNFIYTDRRKDYIADQNIPDNKPILPEDQKDDLDNNTSSSISDITEEVETAFSSNITNQLDEENDISTEDIYAEEDITVVSPFD